MTRNLVLSGGPTHDFDATSRSLIDLLDQDGVESVLVEDPLEAMAVLRAAERDETRAVDLLVVNALWWGMDVDRYADLRADFGFALSDDDAALIERYVVGGGGLLALHTAVICFDAHPVWHRLCGASWNWTSSSHPPLGEVEVRVTPRGRAHELTRDVDDFVISDEVYGFLDEEDDVDPLLSSAHGGRAHPLLWVREVGHGRVVTDLLGHGEASLAHPVHRAVLARAAAWASGSAAVTP